MIVADVLVIGSQTDLWQGPIVTAAGTLVCRAIPRYSWLQGSVLIVAGLFVCGG